MEIEAVAEEKPLIAFITSYSLISYSIREEINRNYDLPYEIQNLRS
jgi:hypothetical protein